MCISVSDGYGVGLTRVSIPLSIVFCKSRLDYLVMGVHDIARLYFFWLISIVATVSKIAFSIL